MNAPTPQYLSTRLIYNALTGRLSWRPLPRDVRGADGWNARSAGKRAGRLDTTGYRQVAVNGRRYPAARIIWALQTGEWPDGEVDHINRDKADDRWENLRLATRAENSANRRHPNASGYKGVKRVQHGWIARIMKAGRSQYLGLFSTPEAAAQAYDSAARDIHGRFAVTNFGD